MILRQNSDAAIAALWAEVQGLTDIFEGDLAFHLERSTRAAIRKVESDIRKGNTVDLDRLLIQHRADILAIMQDHVFDAASLFGGRILEDLGRPSRGWIEEAMPAALVGIAVYASQRYAATTIDRLNRIASKPLDRSRENDMNLLMGRLIRTTAQASAAHEVHAATQQATIAAGEHSGLIRKRMWMSRLDGRERDHHHAAHKQIVGMTEPYIVGGEKLRFPGDFRASAWNWINCRCGSALILE